MGSRAAFQRGEESHAAGLGPRLRERRRSLGLTLREVADRAGLTAGFISQIERGIAAPSLSSLAGVACALEVDPGVFLEPPGGVPLTRHGRRARYAPERSAVSYERVSSSFPGNTLNSVLIHEPPGHRSEPIRHEGEELFFMLEGSITVEIEGARTVLRAGDSIHFDSRRTHSTWNHTTEPATILHVCTMDVFGDAGRRPDPERQGD